ncbi:MAG: hypothetical protein QM784_26315 [Polyangiaceae bacterium]
MGMSYVLRQMVERFLRRFRRRSPQSALRQRGSLLPSAFAGVAPLDLGITGRVVLQSALVGLVAGALGALFSLSRAFASLGARKLDWLRSAAGPR